MKTRQKMRLRGVVMGLLIVLPLWLLIGLAIATGFYIAKAAAHLIAMVLP